VPSSNWIWFLFINIDKNFALIVPVTSTLYIIKSFPINQFKICRFTKNLPVLFHIKLNEDTEKHIFHSKNYYYRKLLYCKSLNCYTQKNDGYPGFYLCRQNRPSTIYTHFKNFIWKLKDCLRTVIEKVICLRAGKNKRCTPFVKIYNLLAHINGLPGLSQGRSWTVI